MANAFELVDWIAAEALMHLEDALIIGPLTARDKTADFNAKPNGYAVGDTIGIKTRPQYQTRDFDVDGAIVKQGIRESKRAMTIEHLYDVSVELTAREKAMDFESFSEQVIKPAAYSLAETCDQYTGTKILEGAGLYASANLFTTAADMALARKAATLQQLAASGRFCLTDLDLEAQLLGADYFSTWNNRGPDGTPVFTNGSMGHAMGMDFFASINFPDATSNAHLAGTQGTAVLTNHPAGDNSLIGTSVLPVDGGATVDLKAGDRLQIAGVRRPLIVAVAFTATSGDIALVDPITEVIPDNAAVTVIGAGQTLERHGAIFDDQSMAIAMPILDPASDKPSFVTSNNGYSIRVVTGYDMELKKEVMSLDLLIGAAAWEPRRITLLADHA